MYSGAECSQFFFYLGVLGRVKPITRGLLEISFLGKGKDRNILWVAASCSLLQMIAYFTSSILAFDVWRLPVELIRAN